MNLGRITCALSLIIGGLKCFDAHLDVLVPFFACHYILTFFKGDLGRNVTPSKNQNCSAGCRNSYLGNIGLFNEIEGYLKQVRRSFPLSIRQL
jgi:hypothetical protein